ncbi:MAG TPA: FecR domain-containing protein, partial [Dongiaceae bacterium]|nr:FecR domain-containing protein [Dongiaceae bacterium]
MQHLRPQTNSRVRSNSSIHSILITGFHSLILLLTCSAPAWACDDWLAKATAITGAVEHKSSADWQPLQTEQVVCPGDSVRVGANSRAALYLRNNTFMRLDENSLVNFPAAKQDGGYWLDLSQGFAHFISRIVNRFEVSTPYVNAVVEGTEFIVSAAPAQASVAVMEGKVKTYNDAGSESITSGQQVQASSRTASLTRLNVPSAKTVEWAIYYPPVLTLNSIQPLTADEKNHLDALQPFLQQNRPDLALQALEQNPASTPALDLARAALLLAVGRVDDFDASIAGQLSGPHAGTAYALKAVADAARNRADSAMTSAKKAVELAPQQAASHIALSYAQQASLQLDDALASAKKTTDVEPSNALGWLRLVELRLTQGDIGAAKKALAQIDKLPAEQQQPKAAILSAKGFVNLFSLKLKDARENFGQAAQLDSADPQNHLGLGLALLRDGKLEDGRQQLEYAVSLDPLRSTFRSYLGRAYFEEKKDKEAIKQWDLAKQFDPNDPTPYFYTGVHKLFANDPIGAIDELETSKELNDKRAIYRDETLLQSDEASRSATLARAYNEVGYDQGVLLNGWDAIRRDPTNSEGHRLLADKYAGNSRYESARASELLQSQLWQPLSAYPLQPQLGETNIAVVEGSGPQRPSFNEYHSLLTRDGAYGMLSGYGGEDDSWGDDLVGSFLAGPIAM